MSIPFIPDMEDAVEEAAMDIVEDAVAIPDIPDIAIEVGVEVFEVVMLILLMSTAVEYLEVTLSKQCCQIRKVSLLIVRQVLE